MLALGGNADAQQEVNIGKNNVSVKNRLMTPEALWAMGRIGSAEASPDGKTVVYQVGYYSVKENKGHQVICLIGADGKNNRQLTTSAKNETAPTWIDNGRRIAFLFDGEIWTMNPDGSGRQQCLNLRCCRGVQVFAR